MTRREVLSPAAVLAVVATRAFAAPQGVVREKAARRSSVVLLANEGAAERFISRLAGELDRQPHLRSNLRVAESVTDLPGLDALEDADLLVLCVSGLRLPGAQLKLIRAYVDSGRPIVALAGSVRAFDNWADFGANVLGASAGPGGTATETQVTHAPDTASHPLLAGVPAFTAPTSPGAALQLAGGARPLLVSGSAPVVWTRTHKGGRVFATSLGRPEDFDVAAIRTLLVNAVEWALGKPAVKP